MKFLLSATSLSILGGLITRGAEGRASSKNITSSLITSIIISLLKTFKHSTLERTPEILYLNIIPITEMNHNKGGRGRCETTSSYCASVSSSLLTASRHSTLRRRPEFPPFRDVTPNTAMAHNNGRRGGKSSPVPSTWPLVYRLITRQARRNTWVFRATSTASVQTFISVSSPEPLPPARLLSIPAGGSPR